MDLACVVSGGPAVHVEREVRRRRPARTAIDWQRALYTPLTVLAWLAVVVIGFWILGHLANTLMPCGNPLEVAHEKQVAHDGGRRIATLFGREAVP
jgi:hypothetical protein